ncbi:unnamed protein product, partial [Mesorhabditis belari]|uniref:Metallo-beta-lactamase domain-containing protein n=1 Tax=Mesorhabditis belari TaxID=2138241 RepID=A0AAF3F8Q8_9BILA
MTTFILFIGLFCLAEAQSFNSNQWSNPSMNRFYNPQNNQNNQNNQRGTNVSQLIVGSLMPIANGFDFVGSSSIITDNGQLFIVDTPNSGDTKNLNVMMQGLQSRGIQPSQINYLITTHGHPDHFGQGHLFTNAKNLMGGFEIAGSAFTTTPLRQDKDAYNLTPNIELWNTPGHTAQDVSLIAHNTVCCGTVAVVGDLILSDQDVLNSTLSMSFAQEPVIAKMNRNRVICASDYIVPGHGPMFRVTDQMRQIAQCQGRLSTDG